MENENLETINTEIENEDVTALDTQKAYYEDIIAKQEAKYGTLLKAYARGERAEASAPAEPTPDELKTSFENDIKSIMGNKGSDLEQAKTLMSIREYRLSLGEPDIFLPQDGTPSQDDIVSANKLGDLLETAINGSEGDDGMFRAIIQKHLVDNKNIKIR